MTEQEKQDRIAAHKAAQTRKTILEEAEKDLKNGKMSAATFEIFKKKNS
jgi:hypothetical protein